MRQMYLSNLSHPLEVAHDVSHRHRRRFQDTQARRARRGGHRRLRRLHASSRQHRTHAGRGHTRPQLAPWSCRRVDRHDRLGRDRGRARPRHPLRAGGRRHDARRAHSRAGRRRRHRTWRRGREDHLPRRATRTAHERDVRGRNRRLHRHHRLHARHAQQPDEPAGLWREPQLPDRLAVRRVRADRRASAAQRRREQGRHRRERLRRRRASDAIGACLRAPHPWQRRLPGRSARAHAVPRPRVSPDARAFGTLWRQAEERAPIHRHGRGAALG